MTVSLIVPTLNADGSIAACIDAVRAGAAPEAPVSQVIVADGGSTDATRGIAIGLGAEIVKAPSGRGAQLCAGAEPATGQWLLFLHADTRLEREWGKAAFGFTQIAGERTVAGYFRFRLDETQPSRRAKARRLENIVAWRCRAFGLPYGDQGLLISRSAYDAVGGFAALPLMEDVEFARRIGRRNMHPLDAAALTSAARYRRDGYIVRPLRNLFCLALYLIGVPIGVVRTLYA